MADYLQIDNPGSVPVKAWTRGVPFEAKARAQVENLARLPFIHSHVAVMPDVHMGMGACIGAVIPTVGAVVPAATGVDIGCGMVAVQTVLGADALPDNLHRVRAAIEAAVPHGRSGHGAVRGDRGAWQQLPDPVVRRWQQLSPRFERIVHKHPVIAKSNHVHHLGTLGTGNHFIELCLDEADRVWVMLHSGSRGVGNRIGTYFIQLAREEMLRLDCRLPDRDLAYLTEGTRHFDDYLEAVEWAQDFARCNRELMLAQVLAALETALGLTLGCTAVAVNCHHNYISREHHYGRDLFVTRKGAVSARAGELGIIPSSMGNRSFIVRGLGNPESFCSCSHGAGRVMSRTEAKKRFSEADQVRATAGVECRKDRGVIDEIPMAYKDIDAVMYAQRELVEVVHTLKQVVCVKG